MSRMYEAWGAGAMNYRSQAIWQHVYALATSSSGLRALALLRDCASRAVANDDNALGRAPAVYVGKSDNRVASIGDKC